MDNNEIYDVAVIGGGPAGLMAAGRAAEAGARVILLEKNKTLGKKLLLTGGGRCNLTQAESDPQALIKNYGTNGRFLYSAFSRFGNRELIDFFERRGLKTKVEERGRVFPVADSAMAVLKNLEGYLKEGRVEILLDTEVGGFSMANHHLSALHCSGKKIVAKNYIVCTGGKSFPGTGSTGDGYAWARKIGHSITRLQPAVTPILIKENFIKRFEGASSEELGISILQNGKLKIKAKGQAVFTGKGMSGPVIINASKYIGQLLAEGSVQIQVDFLPDIQPQGLDQQLQSMFNQNPKKALKNCLIDILTPKIIVPLLDSIELEPDRLCSQIDKESRLKLISSIKELKFTIQNIESFEKAMVTAGGIELKEIDPKSMRSKLIDNLFFAGEILDLDGPTGGYNLQICWSTGWVAGKSAAESTC